MQSFFYSIYKSIFIIENFFRKTIILDDVKKLLIFSSFALMQKMQTGFIVLLPICITYLLIKKNLQINKIYKTIIVCILYDNEIVFIGDINFTGLD